MKKFLLLIALVLALVSISGADMIYENNNPNIKSHMEVPNKMITTQVLTLTADDSTVNLDQKLVGGYLYMIEIYASADDAMTFTINSGLGTELYSTTTSAATSGEIGYPAAFYPVTRIPNYTLANLGSGSVTIEISVVKQ